MGNPRYANGQLRRKHRARLRAMGCECGICHGRFGPIHYDEPSDAQHPLSFVVDEIKPVSKWRQSATRPRGPLRKIGRTYRLHIGSAMHKKATKPPKTAQNRLKSCGFRTFQTAAGEGGEGTPPSPSATPSAVSADLHTGKI